MVSMHEPIPGDSGASGPDDPGSGADSLARWVRQGSHVVPDTAEETRIDLYLARRFPYRTRTQWVAILRSGRIHVDGAVVRPSRTVRPGTRIDYRPEPAVEPPVSLDYRRIHEDDALLAIDKPADLPVHPSGRYFRHTLLSHLLASRGETLDRPGLRIVHRLDRETSGVIVFAKTREAAARLGRQFEGRTAEKEYLLLVHGRPSWEAIRVDGPLGPRRDSRVRKAVGVVAEGGLPAETELRVLGRGPGHALLVARPRTGRLHQIRVHARHAGFPIVGDKLYGLDEGVFLRFVEGEPLEPADLERLVHPRQALHAWRLRLRHPEHGTPLELVAPLATDLVDLARRLEIPLPAGMGLT